MCAFVWILYACININLIFLCFVILIYIIL
uniref:Uncharacterized protein n=1 Tax=Anguilla anguilla TaxID=7936 RepID=A0A0E9SSD7_ANGAN